MSAAALELFRWCSWLLGLATAIAARDHLERAEGMMAMAIVNQFLRCDSINYAVRYVLQLTGLLTKNQRDDIGYSCNVARASH